MFQFFHIIFLFLCIIVEYLLKKTCGTTFAGYATIKTQTY